MLLAYRCALASELVTATAIEANEFPQLSQEMGVYAVPRVVVAGSTLGGFAPEAWGGSAFGVASLGLACLGGIAGVWFAVKLTG